MGGIYKSEHLLPRDCVGKVKVCENKNKRESGGAGD